MRTSMDVQEETWCTHRLLHNVCCFSVEHFEELKRPHLVMALAPLFPLSSPLRSIVFVDIDRMSSSPVCSFAESNGGVA